MSTVRRVLEAVQVDSSAEYEKRHELQGKWTAAALLKLCQEDERTGELFTKHAIDDWAEIKVWMTQFTLRCIRTKNISRKPQEPVPVLNLFTKNFPDGEIFGLVGKVAGSVGKVVEEVLKPTGGGLPNGPPMGMPPPK